MPKPMNHQRGVLRSDDRGDLSVTVPGVCPGAMNRASAA